MCLGAAFVYLTHLCFREVKTVLTRRVSPQTDGRTQRKNCDCGCGYQDDSGGVRRRVVRNTVEEQKVRYEPRRPPSRMTCGRGRAADGAHSSRELSRRNNSRVFSQRALANLAYTLPGRCLAGCKKITNFQWNRRLASLPDPSDTRRGIEVLGFRGEHAHLRR